MPTYFPCERYGHRVTHAVCKARGCADECLEYIRHTTPLTGLGAYLVALVNDDRPPQSTGAGATEPAPQEQMI